MWIIEPVLFINLGSSKLAALVQKPSPNFKAIDVVDGDFKELQLQDYAGKYLVLFFYPLDLWVKILNYAIILTICSEAFQKRWSLTCSTFVCPTEIIAFSDRVQEFRSINTEVVGVSTDSHFSHLAWINLERKVWTLFDLLFFTYFESPELKFFHPTCMVERRLG